MRRQLRLRKETLTELATDDLGSVVGASHRCVTFTVVLTGCQCSGAYPSLNIDCPAGAILDTIVATGPCG